MATFKFRGIVARQSHEHQVLCVTARASDVCSVARIERVARSESGELSGFQRPLIAKHIREISSYLKESNAVLPNALVVAFVGGTVDVRMLDDRICELTVQVPDGAEPPGFVVDGQQRLSALTDSARGDFEAFVSVLVCRDIEELRQQFVLINNTRPLPKSLIYELLPTVAGLPQRFDSRTLGAKMVELLNFRAESALRGLILQHTNAGGLVRDTVVQKLVMNSWNSGALRDLRDEPDCLECCYGLVNDFFLAVRDVWPECFELDFKTTSRRKRVSRLLHGTSIVALGFVMDLLVSRTDAASREEFAAGLKLIAKDCHWTEGSWDFSGHCVPYDGLQYTSQDISLLAHFLCRQMRQRLREAETRVAGRRSARQAAPVRVAALA